MPKFVKFVLYFEAILINLGSGLICFFAPAWFASNFSLQELPPISLELIRWYGVLLFVLSFAVLRMFAKGNLQGMVILVEALLFGDLVHFIAALLYLNTSGVFNAAVAFMFVMNISLAVIRSVWLLKRRNQNQTQEGTL